MMVNVCSSGPVRAATPPKVRQRVKDHRRRDDLFRQGLSRELRAQANDPSHSDDRGKGEYNRRVRGDL